MKLKKLLFILFTALTFGNQAAAQENITLNIKNADIKDVLSAVSALSGKNIITDSDVNGFISITVQNMPFNSALDFITKSKGLSYKAVDNNIVVYRANKTQFNDICAIQLNFINASDLTETLQYMFPDSKISVIHNNNTLLFSGSAIDENKLKNTISILDKPTKQVTLEAKLIAINREDSENLGINWGWDKIPQKEDNSNLNDENDSNNDNYEGSIKLGHGYSFNFTSTLNALFANGKAKLLATPSIITIPGKEASIFIGDHIPVQTEKHDNSGSYTSTEYLDAGIKLTYTPVISTDGKMVTANVHTEVSTPTLISELKNYKITSRTATTNVRMMNGETLIIGGLINEEEQKNIQKIPFLSNIPILGELFKNRTNKKVKTEVIMILTPHITDAGQSPAIYNNYQSMEYK